MACLIVFDLDGTLVDSRRDLADSANELLASYGAGPLPLDAIVAMVGHGARVLVERALAAADVEAAGTDPLQRFLAIYERRLTNHTRAYPGIAEAVEDAASAAVLAVLTNKPGHHARRLLEHLALARFFAAIVGGDADVPRKPDPAGLTHLMRETRVAPRDTLFVGDSAVDVETAQRADVRLCVARYGFGPLPGPGAMPPGTLVADSPADLQPQLRRFIRESRADRPARAPDAGS